MANPKSILVTGGAGFVGSHLCARFLKMGHNVICLDDFSTGSKNNLEEMAENPLFKIIEADVKNLPLNGLNKVEVIYNLACPASPKAYQKDPVKTFLTSILGMLQVLELAKKNNALVIQASTSEIYGDPLQHPQTENYWGNVNPLGTRACYDEGKRGAETLCSDFRRMYGLNIKIARIFNTYGPRMDKDDGRVVSNFIVQALKNQPLTIYGEGSQTRSFQYIDDLINGLAAMMETKWDGEAMNLGNPNEFTMNQLADEVLKLIPESGSKKASAPLPQDDPQKRRPDIALAKKYLGWEPEVELAEGLKKTIDYFKTIKL